MSKSRLWIATLLMAVLVLSACAPVAPDSGSAAPADEAAADESMDETMAEGEMMDWEGVDPSGQTVVFWYQHSDEREEALQQIIQEFNDTNEYGITVEGEYQGGYGDIFTKMLNVLNTSDAPNLVVAYQNQAATYQLADSLVDMTSLVESERWGLSAEDQADFFPGFFNADVFPSFNNERLGFPPNRSMEVLYYNQSWLEELGYDGAPTTPDEFMEMACAAVETPYSAAVGDVGSMDRQ